MTIQWMKRRSVAALATGAVALATFGGSQSGLLAGLFDKDRCELPKRVPCGDCSFGYSRTSWRPWGTCCEARPAQAVPVFVPRGGYSPLDGMPYSTIPSDPHEESQFIIESTSQYIAPSSDGKNLAPILSEPSPGPVVSPVDPRPDQLLPQDQSPLAPEVRSIEAPVQSRPGEAPSAPTPGTPRDAAPPGQTRNSNEYRGPVEDPIRGLLPGAGYSPLPGAQSPVTDVPQNSLPASDSPSSPADSGPTFESAPVTPAPREPQTDYSEYIPLPNADSPPRSLTLPNPADRPGIRTDAPRSLDAVPEREAQAAPANESFAPETLPLPESGTRPESSLPDEPGVSRYRSSPADDPYSDFRVLPSVSGGKLQFHGTPSRVDRRPSSGPVFEEDRVTRTSAERVSRFVQELTPRRRESHRGSSSASQVWSSDRAGTLESEYQPAEWKPLRRSTNTSQSTTDQPASGWRTMRTVTDAQSTGSSSQRRRAFSNNSPLWKSQSRDSRR